MKTRRLTRNALLTAMALTIFMVEAQIPLPVPLPGLKLGLANVVTLYAVFAFGPWDGLMILLCRVFFGSVFAGNMSAVIYSLSGGLLCWLATVLMKKSVGPKQIWMCGVMGAFSHNIGQMAAAVAVTGTPSLVIYLPALLAFGAVTGAFTGLCAQLVLNRGDMPK